jgi:hypothetical protein
MLYGMLYGPKALRRPSTCHAAGFDGHLTYTAPAGEASAAVDPVEIGDRDVVDDVLQRIADHRMRSASVTRQALPSEA